MRSMDLKMIQSAIRAAIKLDIENAQVNLGMDLIEHADEFLKIAPCISKVIVAIAELNVDKIQAEMN